jgi:hypothetical protein
MLALPVLLKTVRKALNEELLDIFVEGVKVISAILNKIAGERGGGVDSNLIAVLFKMYEDALLIFGSNGMFLMLFLMQISAILTFWCIQRSIHSSCCYAHISLYNWYPRVIHLFL